MELILIERQDGTTDIRYSQDSMPYLTGEAARQARIANMLRGIAQPDQQPTPAYAVIALVNQVPFRAGEELTAG